MLQMDVENLLIMPSFKDTKPLACTHLVVVLSLIATSKDLWSVYLHTVTPCTGKVSFKWS